MSNGVEVLVKDKEAEMKTGQTKYMEIKTIQPSIPSHIFASTLPKIDKRVDNDDLDKFEFIQPSEVSHSCTTTSCSCSHTKTEGLKTKYSHGVHGTPPSIMGKYPMKTTKYVSTDGGFKPTNKETLEPLKKTQYGPYEFESSSQIAPTDKVVEKYTEVNDYSIEKDSIEESELLTNEQAPRPPKPNIEKPKPDKVQKINNKNKLVGDLLKLGSLSIKGLSQLAPVFEKMTGGFMKKQDINKTTTSTTSTIKPAVKLTAYNVNKRVDTDTDTKAGQNFPIYIPVDEMEVSESQHIFSNGTLHQSLVWAAEHKHPKSHNILPPKFVHESPLVNGGIPIRPGDIITANSDVIVGKPAVGGPLTLAASGIKLHNNMKPPSLDSFVSESEQHVVQERPKYREQSPVSIKVDDSFDLRPPSLPPPEEKQNFNGPHLPSYDQNKKPKYTPKTPLHYSVHNAQKDNLMKTEHIKTSGSVLGNHGRPAFIDYIPSLAKPNKKGIPPAPHIDINAFSGILQNEEIPDSNPSSSEISSSRVQSDSDYPLSLPETINKPFLVDIQPSRVANVLIPHGSATALVFAGSSEPHKTGDYVDDPLPYPEPGYFGSFSIDAPQMTNVHVAPNTNPLNNVPTLDNNKPKEPTYRNDQKQKWRDLKRPIDYNKIPPPTSNLEIHAQVGPHITVYNPDAYKGDFESYNQIKPKYREDKISIDNDYEKYLAVPPPPRPKVHYKNEHKPYQQLPVVHTKPIQDMKVFLNVQHPVPHTQLGQPVTPKVTSEVYYAEQDPNSRPTPTYTVQIPPTVPENNYDRIKNNQQNNNFRNVYNEPSPNKFASSLNINSDSYYGNQANKTIQTDSFSTNKNIYSVTLNTATNVASNTRETGQGIGSSVPVAIQTTVKQANDNANIPIGTNFSIKVDDGHSSDDSFPANNENTEIKYVNKPDDLVTREVLNIGEIKNTQLNNVKQENIQHGVHNNKIHKSTDNIHVSNEVSPSIAPSLNSHANFPMINEKPTGNWINNKPEKEILEAVKSDQNRPPKLISNISTNSHGWYSSVFKDESLNNINNIKYEVTTRKIIPLIHDYDMNSMPTFGEKMTNIAKPPNDFWSHTIGKPFSKMPDSDKHVYSSSFRPQVLEANDDYLPSNLGNEKQPEYEIPVNDNNDESTATNVNIFSSTTSKPKPVYENAEEVYDGEEEFDNEGEIEGEVSQESMKVPIITSSSEDKSNHASTPGKKILQGEIYPTDSKQDNIHLVQFDPKTQTEKPFKNNTNTFHSNNIKPINSNIEANPKPRPFTMSNLPTTIDHQLHQPHWQINELMVNSTNMSYEEGLDLNLGEEISTVSTSKITPTSTSRYKYFESDYKYKRPRPNFIRPNNNIQTNVSNIITSTVHIRDKKPLVIKEVPEKSTLPTFTIKTDPNYNYSSTEILDLSPPPPTMDYNFKPSTNDETIMGMSPPPPRSPPPVRVPPRIPPTQKPAIPIRTPTPYRNKPPRTLPPRTTTQRTTKKPLRDEISTYRPAFSGFNVNRPIYNPEQPSQILLPPSSRAPTVGVSIQERPATAVVFPTLVSSGWLTSSGVGFSSSFDFGPTPVYFPDLSEPTKQASIESVEQNISTSSYEIDTSSEQYSSTSSEKSEIKYEGNDVNNSIKDASTASVIVGVTYEDTTTNKSVENVTNSGSNELIYEHISTEKINIIPFNFKNRTRKPYPLPEKKPNNTNKINFKPPIRPVTAIKPITTVSRPEIVYPKRPTSMKKVVNPVPTKSTSSSETLIESSESFVNDDFVKPTETLNKVSQISQMQASVNTNPTPIITSELKIEETSTSKPVHHTGNEIKISDEIIPTKTEFRTTVVTLTKTLSEPPKTVSSIGYVNLTHTLTVTQTETSLVSKSEGAITETLVITNTQTSTIVDVITEVHTQVQPTTIIETVTKHIPVLQVQPTSVQDVIIATSTKVPLDDLTMSSEENDNFKLKEPGTTENVQKIITEDEGDNDTFFVVMNKSQNGGKSPPLPPEVETGDYDHITRNEQVNSNGVSQVLFGEILLAGTPYLETANLHPTGVGFGKECQPDCKASRNERCQRLDGVMKCVCRPGFARMFPDRPCKPTYTYSVKLALGSQGNKRLQFQPSLSDNSSKEYHELALATHEGINRMVMQSDLRDVFHGVHITGFQPIEIKKETGEKYQGVMNDFYVQLSDNAHESRLKEVIEKYLRNNNYSLGGIDVHAAGELVHKLEVNDFDECKSGQFHDCSEHAQCFNLRGTYTCSCLEGYADLSVNKLYPGRICSTEPVGCERCNYHGACYSRDDSRVVCECFQWYSGSDCQVNLKVVLISLLVIGVLLTIVLAACGVVACSKPRRSVVTCIPHVSTLHPGSMPGKHRDRRALISERAEPGDGASLQNSLPYVPSNKHRTSTRVLSPPPAHAAPPPPPAVVIPRARLLNHDSRDNLSRKKSLELSSEAKLISYLESGATGGANDEMRRKHSMESSYSAHLNRPNKQGALVSAGFKVSTTIRPDEQTMKEDRERERERDRDRDDISSVNKAELDLDMSSQGDMSEWTDAERRLGELTLSEARSVGGTLPASTGRAASSTRLTHQEAHTMAERELGSTFLLPHVHLYKPDITSDVSEFDSL